MNFLPFEDVKIVWLLEESDVPREGHAWYDGQYCRFELDRSSSGCDDCASCLVYLLYAMRGATLVNELARRKLSELAADGILFIDADIRSLVRDGHSQRDDELQFIGRFIGLSARRGRSIEFESSGNVDKGSAQTWLAPITRALGGMLHKRSVDRRGTRH